MPLPQPLDEQITRSMELYQIIQEYSINDKGYHKLLDCFNSYIASETFGKIKIDDKFNEFFNLKILMTRW